MSAFQPLSHFDIKRIEDAWRRLRLRHLVVAETGFCHLTCSKYRPRGLERARGLTRERRAAIEQAWRENRTLEAVKRAAKCGTHMALRCKPADMAPPPSVPPQPWSAEWREEFARRWQALDPHQVMQRLAQFLMGQRADAG